MAWYAFEPLVGIDPSRALALALESKLPNILNFTTRRVAAIGTPETLAEFARVERENWAHIFTRLEYQPQ